MNKNEKEWINEFFPGILDAFPDWEVSVDWEYTEESEVRSYRCVDVEKDGYCLSFFRDTAIFDNGKEDIDFDVSLNGICLDKLDKILDDLVSDNGCASLEEAYAKAKAQYEEDLKNQGE